MKYRNLTLVGTSHIAKQSLEDVRRVIETEKPELICLELDRKRAYALIHNIKGSTRLRDIPRIGVKGYLFSLIGAWAERKLGDAVGVSPGEEMKTGLVLAKERKIKVALIDQDIEVTLKRFSKALTWREKWNFIVDLVKGVIFKEKKYQFDLSKVPSKDLIKKMIDEVRVRYPNLYKVLVVERNEYMAKKLIRIMVKKPEGKIVAFVGAGHEKEMIDMIKEGINKVDSV